MNGMGKILEAFLNEQLHVDGGTEGRSLEQQKICERGSELQDKLAKKTEYRRTRNAVRINGNTF